MPDYSVKTTITAVDQATEVVRGISAAFSRLIAPIKAVNQAVSEPKTTALGKVGAAADGVAGKFRAGLSSISGWLPALGALGSAASLAGLISMTRHSAEGFEGLTLAAQKLGMSTGDLAVFRFGAKLANVESEQLEKGLVKLNRTMYDAATGKNKDAALLFRKMGIDVQEARKNVAKSLPDIAESFKRTENAETRVAMATALFGRTGADLIPFLIKGRDGIAELAAEMKKYSGLNDTHRHDLGELADAYKQLDKAGSGLSSRLSAVLAPVLNRVVRGVTDWIVRNRELIAQSLERKIDGITRAAGLLTGAFATVLAQPIVAEWMKGMDASTGFDVALGALGLTMAGPLLSAIQVVIAAWGRMTLAMVANPVVATLALIGLAGYALVTHWDENMEAIRKAWDKGFGPAALEVFWRFNGFVLIGQGLDDLVKKLTGISLVNLGVRLMQGLIDGIKSLLPDFQKLWSPIEKAATWVGAGVRSGVSSAMNGAASPAFAGASPDFVTFMPQAYAFQGAGNGAPAAPQRTDVNVKVDFENTPPGTRTTVETAGAANVTRNVGYSMGGGGAP